VRSWADISEARRLEFLLLWRLVWRLSGPHHRATLSWKIMLIGLKS
jgi:hypothetical protein